MSCEKCGANAHLEEEFSITGSIFSLACISCGWRGPVLIDNRIKCNKGEEGMAKRGTCSNPECKKENVQLVAKGLCRKCYTAQRTPDSVRDCKSHSKITKIPVEKPTKVFISDGISSDVATMSNKIETKDVKEMLENRPGKIFTQEQYSGRNIQISIPFVTDDIKLFQELEKNCKINRRTIENEILFILDEHIKRINYETNSKT